MASRMQWRTLEKFYRSGAAQTQTLILTNEARDAQRTVTLWKILTLVVFAGSLVTLATLAGYADGKYLLATFAAGFIATGLCVSSWVWSSSIASHKFTEAHISSLHDQRDALYPASR